MTVMHIDANSAYVSWTAAALSEKGFSIDLTKTPAVVAGDPQLRHGIVLAKSIPAKRYGVVTGESLAAARRKCPGLLIWPADYDLYLSCSDAMYALLQEYFPVVQRYSIDECFTDCGQGKSLSELEDAAFSIKERIKDELGFTVNVGIGTNRLLAKMAGELEKPDRVHRLTSRGDIAEKLWPLPVEKLFMVGPATAEKLRRINIRTIGQLAAGDPVLLRNLLKRHGEKIREYANGIDDSRVVSADYLTQKGLSNSMTVRYDVTDGEEAQAYLLSLTERVSSRLRRLGYRASRLGISLRTDGFVRYTHQQKLSVFLDDTTEIYRRLCGLFRQCWRGEPLRQLGVFLSDFVSDGQYQLSVFDSPKQIRRDEALNRAVDQIRCRFGQTAVFRGIFANSELRPLEGGVNDGNYLMIGGYRL